MNTDRSYSGETVSCWMGVVPKCELTPALPRRVEEVTVIGAGIAGLTTAYFLAKEGRSVSIFDMGPIGGGQTMRTSAHLSCAMDDGFQNLIRYHGLKKTRLIVDSHAAAIDRIEAICLAEKIDCDFERVHGFLFGTSEQDHTYIANEWRAVQKLGYVGAERLDRMPGVPLVSPLAKANCLRFSQQAQFHPGKYLNGLVRALDRLGVRIHTGMKVQSIDNPGPVRITFADGMVLKAMHAVVATNTPINDRFAIHMKQAPYRSYAIAARVPKENIAHALYWDVEDPYHYVRVAPDGLSSDTETLIIGGEDHKTGQDSYPERRFKSLERWAREKFPMIQSFVNRWSGQVFEPVDGAAFIGRNPGDQNIYVITGDSGHGLTHGTIGGVLITDLIQARSNPWEEVYQPARVSFKSGLTFLKENLNVAFQYLDYARSPDVSDVREIRPGEGAIIQRGIRKLAVFRDITGKTTELSASCTHLSGVVQWNSVEKSWDCPCHGARFDATGKVITGPAIRDLEAAEPEVPAEIARTATVAEAPFTLSPSVAGTSAASRKLA